MYEQGELVQLAHPAVLNECGNNSIHAGEIGYIVCVTPKGYVLSLLYDPRTIIEVQEKEIERCLQEWEYGSHLALTLGTPTS